MDFLLIQLHVMQPTIFLKNGPQDRCFFYEFSETFLSSFFLEITRWLSIVINA